jgi:hypothetical protein
LVLMYINATMKPVEIVLRREKKEKEDGGESN